jgi:hypothetical protein
VFAIGFVFKFLLAVALIGAIVLSASAKAPAKALPRADLRWLLLGAGALYAVGLVAFLKHHSDVAALLAAGGIATSTLTAWLSRGSDAGGDPPRRGEPDDEQPPDSGPSIDWPQFERDLQEYAGRSRAPVA